MKFYNGGLNTEQNVNDDDHSNKNFKRIFESEGMDLHEDEDIPEILEAHQHISEFLGPKNKSGHPKKIGQDDLYNPKDNIEYFPLFQQQETPIAQTCQTSIFSSGDTQMTYNNSSTVVGAPQQDIQQLQDYQQEWPKHQENTAKTNKNEDCKLYKQSIIKQIQDVGGDEDTQVKEFQKLEFQSSTHKLYLTKQNSKEEKNIKIEPNCKASSYLKLDIISEQQWLVQCCFDKMITRFIQDRLRYSNDQEELNNFYQKVVNACSDDSALLSMCKHQNGNYVIQLILSNLHQQKSDELLQHLVRRICNYAEVLSFQRFGCRVIQTCLGLGDLEAQLLISSILVNDLPFNMYHNNASHVIQKIIFQLGKCEEIVYMAKILQFVHSNVLQLVSSEYSSRIVLQCFQYCTEEYKIRLADEICTNIENILSKISGQRLIRFLIDQSILTVRRKIIGCIINLMAQKNDKNLPENVQERLFTSDWDQMNIIYECINQLDGQLLDNLKQKDAGLALIQHTQNPPQSITP